MEALNSINNRAKIGSGVTDAFDSTLSKIFPNLIFQIPTNEELLDDLEDSKEVEEFFHGLYGEEANFKNFILQSQIQPLFFSPTQQQKNLDRHREKQDFSHNDGAQKAIGCNKPYTQCGGEPEHEDTQLVGFGIPWPTR